MASAHDVAAYVLERIGPTPAMKLQKLLYYAQAWSLVWDEKSLFDERIEAWVNGPVIPELYQIHKGQFLVESWKSGNLANLNDTEMETIDSVLNFYGSKNAQWLSDLTHRERPWIEARSGLADDERGENEISLASMHEYYSSLARR